MWWYGRGNSGGSGLPEEKKANMWHGRRNSGGSWPPAFPRSVYKYWKTWYCIRNICIGGIHVFEDMIVYKEYMYGGLHILEDMIVYKEYM